MFADEEDGMEIHEAAMNMLHSMSDEEKAAAQQELLATLSPEMLSLLRNPRALGSKPSQAGSLGSDPRSDALDRGRIEGNLVVDSVAPGAREASRPSIDEALSSIRSEEELDALLTQQMAQASEAEQGRVQWLQQNTPSLERSERQDANDPPSSDRAARRRQRQMDRALQSLTGAPAGNVSEQLGGHQEVRFDLEGRILSHGGDSEAATEGAARKDAALYHHGGSPDQAGYTFGDLEQIMLSTFPPQRSIGLKVFSALLQRWEDKAYGLRLSLRIRIPESSVEALMYSLRYSAGTTTKVCFRRQIWMGVTRFGRFLRLVSSVVRNAIVIQVYILLCTYF